jgi:hypothetical protein
MEKGNEILVSECGGSAIVCNMPVVITNAIIMKADRTIRITSPIPGWKEITAMFSAGKESLYRKASEKNIITLRAFYKNNKMDVMRDFKRKSL